MESTYCGKDCAECSWKRDLGCAGCREASGGSKDCPIARCCQSGRRESCQSCSTARRCTQFDARYQLPKKRLGELLYRREQAAAAKDQAGKLFPRVYPVFALSIPLGILLSLITNPGIAYLPRVYPIARVLCIPVFAILSLLLLTFPGERKYFRGGGLCLLAGAVAALMTTMHSSFWATLISLLAFLAGELLFFRGCEEALSGVDEALAENWAFLSKWRTIVHVDVIFTAMLQFFASFSPLFFALIKTCSLAVLVPLYLFRIIEQSRNLPDEEEEDGGSPPVPTDYKGVQVVKRSIRAKFISELFVLTFAAALGLLGWCNLLVCIATSIWLSILLLRSAGALRDVSNS